jgi:hypothetical protein
VNDDRDALRRTESEIGCPAAAMHGRVTGKRLARARACGGRAGPRIGDDRARKVSPPVSGGPIPAEITGDPGPTPVTDGGLPLSWSGVT